MEFVYVVKRYDLFDRAFPHGFVNGAAVAGSGCGTAGGSGTSRGSGTAGGSGAAGRDGSARLATWTRRIREHGFFLERARAERDSSFKQIIPYTVVACGDEVLRLRRLAAGGERRLHGKLSIGVGGHINPVDGGATPGGAAATTDVLAEGCRRELEEELLFDTSFSLSAVGAINDESDDVGSVHFGLVHLARCETRDVSIRETDVLEGRFLSVDDLLEESRGGADFETWSALIVPHLRELLA